jgi:putative transposase
LLRKQQPPVELRRGTRRTPLVLKISVDISEAKTLFELARQEGGEQLQSLTAWTRGFVQQGIEALLRAELAVVLERDREPNSRNGYRARTLSLAGLGPLALRVPRDRQSRYRSELLPFRKRRTLELEAMAAEMFLGGLSTRDVSRVLERHFGDRFDSKEISRMVASTSDELDVWRRRDLSDTAYRFLYCDGAYFSVRRGGEVEKIPVLCVVGARADDEKLEVLALEIGDREQKALWAELFQDLSRRGLDLAAVELGIMDGLPGLEAAFQAAFARAQTQRCQVHAKRNILKRVSKKDREAFRKDLDAVFYAKSESKARRAFSALKVRWKQAYPTAVGILARDLDSLLRFFQWEEQYWPSLRTTNPIERVHKEFKRRTKAMEIVGSEGTMYRLLAYVALTMNFGWRKYALSTPRYFYTLKAA